MNLNRQGITTEVGNNAEFVIRSTCLVEWDRGGNYEFDEKYVDERISESVPSEMDDTSIRDEILVKIGPVAYVVAKVKNAIVLKNLITLCEVDMEELDSGNLEAAIHIIGPFFINTLDFSMVKNDLVTTTLSNLMKEMLGQIRSTHFRVCG